MMSFEGSSFKINRDEIGCLSGLPRLGAGLFVLGYRMAESETVRVGLSREGLVSRVSRFFVWKVL